MSKHFPIRDGSVSEEIAQALSKFLTTSTYACGGTVKISQLPADTTDTPATVTAVKTSAESVTIRWDSATLIEKLTLPLSSETDHKTVEKLVEGTQPASFGYQGQDVIDESYRKASKLDTSAFSTNFCPYEVGIIDVIGQALLPKVPSSSQGIHAELYKLNIYQGPSGMFKPHVDTPRSDLQIGSLVVCLPCAYEGGQLVVRHQGHSTIFDWSGSATDVQWAAFYSDCEHEVLEVTSGHRITLTYNLFVRHGLGEIAGRSEALDAQQLPVYKEVKDVLANPGFMPDGGLLGKYCTHAYAHATKEGATALPSVLKGSDMVAYEVFRALGVEVHVRPVMEHISKDMYEEYVVDELATHNHIGKQLSEPVNTNMETGENGGYELEEIYQALPSSLERVTWLNEPTPETESMQMAFLRYGNQAEGDFIYSYCALLFKILPYTERVEVAKMHGYSI